MQKCLKWHPKEMSASVNSAMTLKPASGSMLKGYCIAKEEIIIYACAIIAELTNWLCF